jgi:hypothetical protein
VAPKGPGNGRDPVRRCAAPTDPAVLIDCSLDWVAARFRIQ